MPHSRVERHSQPDRRPERDKPQKRTFGKLVPTVQPLVRPEARHGATSHKQAVEGMQGLESCQTLLTFLCAGAYSVRDS